MKSMSLIFACLFLVIPCKAETIVVDHNGSEDFTNIQDAIDYSWDGDIIIVRPGSYSGNISFNRALRRNKHLGKARYYYFVPLNVA